MKSHFDEGHLGLFFGQPLKNNPALDGPLVFLPHESSTSIRYCCVCLIMSNSSQYKVLLLLLCEWQCKIMNGSCIFIY
jgi:hypothetical protein